MNSGFSEFLRAAPRDRRDVFLGAATRLGTPEQNIEKDFWVTWTLDVLFNGLPAGHPRFLFKGGTSLSKAYGLISRFSEDIDITVYREDLGQEASVPELEALSRKKRQTRLDAIKETCRQYIQNTLAQQFGEAVQGALAESKVEANVPSVVVDPDERPGRVVLVSHSYRGTRRVHSPRREDRVRSQISSRRLGAVPDSRTPDVRSIQ
jgi:Nucleotidyl transferase AbiEii toxin, Type IV TA system